MSPKCMREEWGTMEDTKKIENRKKTENPETIETTDNSQKSRTGNSHRFFENRDCPYFPCHAGMEGSAFNCLFCYCPMNPYADCPGNPVFRKNQAGREFKDCTGCPFPHLPENYDAVLAFLRKKMYE